MLKRTLILQTLLLLYCITLLVSCRKNHYAQDESTASLHLTVRSSGTGLKTRGIEDLDDDGNVSEEEIYADGRKIYRLALFLFNGNRVVSSEILESDDPRFSDNNSEATISFTNLDYSESYTIYAVANYGNYGTMEGNLADVNEDNVTSGLKVTATSDNICNRQTPYPLSFTKEINLTPGANVISGELLRTFARLRINVRNQSSHNDLQITGLDFPANFTQKSADLFTQGGNADVSPAVSSSNAITPFVENMMIAKMDDSNKVSESTIFDTYMLESTGGNYSYTLSLKYEGGTEEAYTVNNTAIRNSNNIEDGAMYIIYSSNAGRYLYAGNGYVMAGNSYLTDGELNHNYVWKFNRTGTNQYTVESMGTTGYFMQSSQASTSRVPLTVNPSSSDYFTASTSSNNIRLRTTKNNYYLAVNGSTVLGYGSGNRRNFYLYKVEKSQISTDITHTETIPISIVDKISGEANPITAIHRNDFIDILVNVTYNEKTGDVEFEVSDWERVDGDVTFD